MHLLGNEHKALFIYILQVFAGIRRVLGGTIGIVASGLFNRRVKIGFAFFKSLQCFRGFCLGLCRFDVLQRLSGVFFYGLGIPNGFCRFIGVIDGFVGMLLSDGNALELHG